MKHILSVDVQKNDETYTFTIHHAKCINTIEFRCLHEGFKKVIEIVKGKNEILSTNQNCKRSE